MKALMRILDQCGCMISLFEATSGELMSSAVCVIFDCNIHIDVAERMLRRA